MNAEAVLDRVHKLGINIRAEGNRLKYAPKSAMPSDLLEELRQHKSDLLTYLTRPKVKDAPDEWHAEEVARCVEEEGICIFWSDLFGEMVGFIRDESFQDAVPGDIVVYTSQEIDKLFPGKGKKPSKKTLKLVHEAKKHGGRITSYEPKKGRENETS